jgi:D-tyrosyl-tRNA(Tyr) deacylase
MAPSRISPDTTTLHRGGIVNLRARFPAGLSMRVILQRVSTARVLVDREVVGAIDRGWLTLLGVARGDATADAGWLAEKVANLRAFPDDEGKMNRSVRDVGGGVLVVSNFTLYADCQKGRRPSFIGAALPEDAEPLYRSFCDALRALGMPVAEGRFGAMMQVELVNDGPVTFILDSPPARAG